jgi:hypothetical protein
LFAKDAIKTILGDLDCAMVRSPVQGLRLLGVTRPAAFSNNPIGIRVQMDATSIFTLAKPTLFPLINVLLPKFTFFLKRVELLVCHYLRPPYCFCGTAMTFLINYGKMGKN